MKLREPAYCLQDFSQDKFDKLECKAKLGFKRRSKGRTGRQNQSSEIHVGKRTGIIRIGIREKEVGLSSTLNELV